ncbi:MAG TPA: response regulator [Flavipsychrobacter sp.]|nr:response regulator [Flavipsychrobacter sp.]
MILIVDDRPENILSLRHTLELHNLKVDSAGSGDEALFKVLKNDYSLIILDVQMPGMDGFEVAEAISGYSRTREIPIIFLSAVNTDKRFITKGYDAGGIDYVTKPVDPDILLLKIKTLTRLYEQKKELKSIHAALRAEIAERKKAEEALSAKVHEQHSIIEAIPQIAFTARPDGTIEFVNEHWFKYAVTKCTFPEVTSGVSLSDQWVSMIAKEEPMEMEVCIRELNTGNFRYHLLRALPVRDEEHIITKWVGTLTDIHEQRKTSEVLEQKVAERTQELQRSNEELETKNYELQQFTSVASHDLKEPLRKIQVFSSIIRDKVKAGEYETIPDHIERIISSGERMSSLISDLLSYSRLSVNSLFEPCNLNGVVHDIISDLEIQIVEKAATIRVGELPVIDAIPGQIRQLFQNILSNALKFSRTDVPPVVVVTAESVASLHVDAPRDEHGAFCRITIGDNGIGFDEQFIDKIFFLFQRLNSKEAFEGTGIGLSIAKKIVERHDGLITARSKEQSGSTFIIILPIHQQGSVIETLPDSISYHQ